MDCKLNDKVLNIKMIPDETYEVSLPGVKATSNFGKPKMEDKFDGKLKQLFDTYTFESPQGRLVVKRPETKGQIKKPFAEWNKQTFVCEATSSAKSKKH